MSKLVTRGLTAVAALAFVLTAAPANAETATFTDTAGDIRPGADLQTVKVANGPENVYLTLTARNLVRSARSAAGAAIFLDTDGDRGPDYLLSAGLFDGTDYSLAATDSWNLRSARTAVPCSYHLTLDYAADTARVRIGKDCFAEAAGDGSVRVEVRTSATDAAGDQVVDWLGKARAFGAAVAETPAES